jgi:hypothetical protein
MMCLYKISTAMVMTMNIAAVISRGFAASPIAAENVAQTMRDDYQLSA